MRFAKLSTSKVWSPSMWVMTLATGLDWPAVAPMDEATLERRLLAAPQPSDAYAQASYGRIHQELRRKDMTLALPREEYSESGMPHR